MKIFISFASGDRRHAERLYGKLVAAGAEVFQFGRSESPGAAAWKEILEWINGCDVFVTFVSKQAAESGAVEAEIEHANYSHIVRRKPARIIAAVLETGVKLPVQIERFTSMDFSDHDRGATRLLSKLDLEELSSPTLDLPTLDLPRLRMNPDALFADYKRKNRGPDPVKKWADQAGALITNYNKLKPEEISEGDRKEHIDHLLTQLSGKPTTASPKIDKLNDLFLRRIEFPRRATSTEVVKWLASQEARAIPTLSEAPSWTTADPTMPRLTAPKLSVGAARGLAQLQRNAIRLAWTPSLGASSYVLERSQFESFDLFASTVYEGDETEFNDTVISLSFYRVKAKGPANLESAWSNVVTAKSTSTRFSP